MTLKSINGCLVSVDGQLEPCDCPCDVCTTGNLCQFFEDENIRASFYGGGEPGFLEAVSQIPFNSSFGPYQLLGKYFDVTVTIDEHYSSTQNTTYDNLPQFSSIRSIEDTRTGSATFRFRMARSGLSQAELSALFGPPVTGEWTTFHRFDACETVATRDSGAIYYDVSSNTTERRLISTLDGEVLVDLTEPLLARGLAYDYFPLIPQNNNSGLVLPGVPADGFLLIPIEWRSFTLNTPETYFPGYVPFPGATYTGFMFPGPHTPEEWLDGIAWGRTGGQAEGEAVLTDDYTTYVFRTQASRTVSRGPFSSETLTASSTYDVVFTPDNYGFWSGFEDFDWTLTRNLTVEFVTVLDCPPGSPVWDLPTLDCPSQSTYRVAFDCANQYLITYDPSDTHGTQGIDWVTIEFEGRRYVPVSPPVFSVQEPPPGLVFSLDTCRETVLGYPCAVGQSDPYPVDVADIPAGALTFRVGEVIYRLTGDVTGLIGRPVDEWLFEPCPEFEWEIVERCNPNGIPGYPDVARAPILDDVGTRCVIVEPRPDLGPGCLVIIEYRRTGEPTNDLDLPVISFSSQDNACRPDTLRCDGQGGGPPSDICQYCLGLPPAVRPPWCADVIQDCLSFRGFQDPGVARAIQRQARAAGCRGCGDPGVDAMM